jgi:hypothetical protein
MNVNPKRLTKRTFHYRASILPRDIWQSSYDCNLKSQNLSAKARLFCTSAFWSAKGNLPSLRWLDARPRPGVDSRKDLASPDDTEVPWRAMYSKSLDFKEVVGASGFEPPTSWSRTRRASQAALRPELNNAEQFTWVHSQRQLGISRRIFQQGHLLVTPPARVIE